MAFFSSLVQKVDAHEVLRLFGAGPLGEVHEVDGVAARASRSFDGLVEGRLGY
jgi:hypothetical protein